MRKVVYSSPFVPAEWIAAHGLVPCRLVPAGSRPAEPAGDRPGLCAYLRMFLDEAAAVEDACAMVLTTSCDQMRRAVDPTDVHDGLPVFVMDVPATWQTVTAHQTYQAELQRLSRFLTLHGGRTPSDDEFAAVIEDLDQIKRILRHLVKIGRSPPGLDPDRLS